MRGYGGAAIVVLTATVAWLMVQLPVAKDDAASAKATATQANASVTEIEKQVNANAEALADANRRLVALGKAPVPVPPAQPPLTDEFTPDEAAAVRLIVADQIARAPAQITPTEVTQIARVASAFVVKPKDGKTPTPAELTPIVKVVLAQYCTEDRCVGPRGTDGPKGEKGDPAPAVTDAQLLAASAQSLTAYCGQPEKPCQGKDGVAGKDAPPPYSVVDTDCVGDGDQSVWKTYLSNGTDQKTLTTRGPCRIGPDPD